MPDRAAKKSGNGAAVLTALAILCTIYMLHGIERAELSAGAPGIVEKTGNLRGKRDAGVDGSGLTVYLIGVGVPALCCMVGRCAYNVVAQVVN